MVLYTYLYENRTMKLAEIVLSREEGEEREMMEGGEFNQGTLQAYMEMSQ
jgi:hypothetical protein